jgi:[3-methyl-2-oxobutanoate dehydrogenase (acetyl-transferring)] kinase
VLPVFAEGGVGLATPGSRSDGSSSSSSSSSESDEPGFDQAAAADAHLVQTAAAFGNLLSSVSAAPQQRYSLAGLGFGLPMSRLYARYFGR